MRKILVSCDKATIYQVRELYNDLYEKLGGSDIEIQLYYNKDNEAFSKIKLYAENEKYDFFIWHHYQQDKDTFSIFELNFGFFSRLATLENVSTTIEDAYYECMFAYGY